MIKKYSFLIIWIITAAIFLGMMILYIPTQFILDSYEEYYPSTIFTKEAQLIHHRVSDPGESRHMEYLKNYYHPYFHSENLLTAEEHRLHGFLQSETGMSHEAVWILMRHVDDKDLSIWMVLGLIHVETGGRFDGNLVGRHQDRGYMQITPITEKHLFENYGELWNFSYNPEHIFEPWYNLTLGTKYLAQIAANSLQEDGEINWHRVLSEYNLGPSGMERLYRWRNTYETIYSNRILQRKNEWKEKYKNINIQQKE